ncbi:MAG: ligase-associated DNA damage response endonuclease PdeM [Phycisphaerae bacterium]|nr:ligase-associated DNA damage response endonuclease PdeM [Phycisphaerae bacterium]
MVVVEWHSEALHPRADRGLWWPRERTLFIADPHFGKDAAFRSAGIPVPAASGAATIARLDRALRDTEARRLVVLGDFWHARAGCTQEVLGELLAFRERFSSVGIMLIRGNHDLSAGDPPAELRIECFGEQSIGPFRLLHEPPEEMEEARSVAQVAAIAEGGGCAGGASTAYAASGFDSLGAERSSQATLSGVLCGHVHPCATFSDSGGSARFPCFVFDRQVAVLPAFGEFTGMHRVRPVPERRIIVAVENSIFEVPRQNLLR